MKCSSQETNQPATHHRPFDQCQPTPQTNHRVFSILTIWLNRIGDLFVNLFVSSLEQSEEIRIWQRVDRHGQIWWHAYNPRTEQLSVFESESEVRVWLEQQYHI